MTSARQREVVDRARPARVRPAARLDRVGDELDERVLARLDVLLRVKRMPVGADDRVVVVVDAGLLGARSGRRTGGRQSCADAVPARDALSGVGA